MPKKIKDEILEVGSESKEKTEKVASTREVVGSDGKKYLKSYNAHGDVLSCEPVE